VGFGAKARAAQRECRLALLGLLLLLAGCDPGDVRLVEPVGAVRGSVLEVRVLRPDGEPAAGATVHYFRRDRYEEHWHETVADGQGMVVIDGLAPGALYWVAAEQEDPQWGVLGGAEKVHAPPVRGTTAVLEVPLFTSRQGGIVISETYFTAPPLWEVGGVGYEGSKYLEVANNSDELIYLDGMLLAKIFQWHYSTERFGHNACEDNAPMRLDSLGVWVDQIFEFPGSGSDFPLAPGEAAVIAASATDHRAVHPSFLNLSDARFEFVLEGWADNPAAANMISRGPEHFIPFLTITYSAAFWAVAAPTQVAALRQECNPGETRRCIPYRFLPRELLHDVALLLWDYSGHGFLGPIYPPCDHPIHPSFDRMPGGFIDSHSDFRSMERRRVLVDGRPTLLNTGTSYIDFRKAPRTPGWLP
jgi:hypothetical protein